MEKKRNIEWIYVIVKYDNGCKSEFNWIWKGPKSLADAYKFAIDEDSEIVGFKWHFC